MVHHIALARPYIGEKEPRKSQEKKPNPAAGMRKVK
jgi:hypothetical protein